MEPSLFLQLVLRSKKIRNRANICSKTKQLHKRSRILFFDTSFFPHDHRSVSEAQSLLREEPQIFLKGAMNSPKKMPPFGTFFFSFSFLETRLTISCSLEEEEKVVEKWKEDGKRGGGEK